MTPILLTCHSRLYCNICHRASAKTVEMSLECQASDLLHGFKDFCKSAVKTLLELSSKAPQAPYWVQEFVMSLLALHLNFNYFDCCFLVTRPFISFHHFTSIVGSLCLCKALQKDNQAFLMMCKKGAQMMI